jgi:hypothetical protein
VRYETLDLGFNVWQRMEDSVLNVRRRLERASAALVAAGVPFAVVGGNAVAAWVATVDEGAVRATRDVDLMIRRPDLERMREVLEGAGFVYSHVARMDLFLDHADARATDAIHLVFAGEVVSADNPVANPDIEGAVMLNGSPTIALQSLVEMKLTAWRRKDQVHLVDMIQLRLLDESWLDRVPAALRGRLQELLDDPEG